MGAWMYQQQQQEKKNLTKNSVAVAASKRSLTTSGNLLTKQQTTHEVTKKQQFKAGKTNESAERQVVSTIGGKMTVQKNINYGIGQTIATWQSWIIGGWIGAFAVIPVLVLHNFLIDPTYESLAQLSWDTAVCVVQGAVFAAVYRYAVREDWDEVRLGKGVFVAFFLVRSLMGIDVPMSCSTPFLFCKLILHNPMPL